MEIKQSITVLDNSDVAHKIDFLIDSVDLSGLVALDEAGKEYSLKKNEFALETIVLDCGAGYGEFSIECALKGAFKVFAFEPNLNLVKLLSFNTSTFPSIQVCPSGAWIEDKDSWLHFRISGTASASINEIQFDPMSKIGKERIKVRVSLIDLGKVIDEIATEYPHSLLALKLDIEGAEHRLLTYLSETKRLEKLQKIWVEYHYEHQNLLDLLSPEFTTMSVQHKGSGIGLIHAERSFR